MDKARLNIAKISIAAHHQAEDATVTRPTVAANASKTKMSVICSNCPPRPMA